MDCVIKKLRRDIDDEGEGFAVMCFTRLHISSFFEFVLLSVF